MRRTPARALWRAAARSLFGRPPSSRPPVISPLPPAGPPPGALARQPCQCLVGGGISWGGACTLWVWAASSSLPAPPPASVHAPRPPSPASQNQVGQPRGPAPPSRIPSPPPPLPPASLAAPPGHAAAPQPGGSGARTPSARASSLWKRPPPPPHSAAMGARQLKHGVFRCVQTTGGGAGQLWCAPGARRPPPPTLLVPTQTRTHAPPPSRRRLPNRHPPDDSSSSSSSAARCRSAALTRGS